MGLSVEQANQILTDNGYFQGLNRLFNQFMAIPCEKGAAAKVHVFNLLLEKIVEAKVRIAKLQVSANRLEAACRDGMVPKPAEGLNFNTNDIYAFLSELRAFDGFAASILESDAALVAAVYSPETAVERMNNPRTAYGPLWARQKNDSFQMLSRDRGLFEMVDFPERQPPPALPGSNEES